MSVKNDLLKKINASVKRKKELAKEVSREKTVAYLVSEFFSEVEKTKDLDRDSGIFAAIALSRLIQFIKKIDYKATVLYKQPASSEAHIEIRWSDNYVSEHNCEPTTVMDAASAFFQNMMDRASE